MPVPLLLPALFWCLGTGLAASLKLPLLSLISVSLAALAAGFIFRFRLPFLLLLIALAGFVRLSVSVNKQPSPLLKRLSAKENLTQPCSGEVLKVLNPSHDYYLVRLTSVNEVSVSDQAYMPSKKILLPGDRFTALARLNQIKSDPALDDISFYQTQRRQQTQITLNPVYRLETLSQPNQLNLQRVRYHLLRNLELKLGSAAPFAKAVLLNDRTADRDWIEQLIQGGLVHLIAISGLHVMFFYFIFVTLFNVFLPRRASELIFVFLMLIYAGFCQWSAPVMRASLMILLYLFAKWLQRPVAPLQIMALSLLIITLIDPLQLFSVGLQLSYLSVFVIFYVLPKSMAEPDKKSQRKTVSPSPGNYFLDMVKVSAAVSLALVPLTLFYFQRGSFNSIIGNLVAIPLMALLLPLTFALMVMPAGWIGFDLLKSGFDFLHYLFQHWVAWTARLPFYIDTVVIPLSLLLALYLALAALALRIRTGLKLRRLSYLLLLLAIPFAVYAWLPRAKPFTLTVFNAGQGDCTLVEYPSGETLLIDTGPQYYDSRTNQLSTWFGRKTAAWQQKRRINRIDLLILTHLDSDHSGGLEDVFSRMRVRRMLVNSFTAASKEWQALLDKGFLSEAELIVLSDTMSFSFAGSRISILHPDSQYRSFSGNDNSIVLRLDYKDFSALMTADISASVEARLLQRNPALLDADFLKAPHHGSRHSSSQPFIRAVSPAQVCITAGRNNPFSFPHRETLQRYRAYGIEPRVTANGSVIVTIR